MHREAAVPVIAPVEPGGVVRSVRYKAKIDGVSPLSRRDTFEQHEACFLGISLENSNFVRPKLVGILEWVARRFRHCTVLVGDSIHRITLETTRGLGPEAALAEALRLGRDFIEHERHVFDDFGAQTRFSFLTCSEVQTWPEYAGHHRKLLELYQHDARFRSSVESFGRQYQSKRALELSEEEREWRVQRSSAYFLEEFAIFACLQQRGIKVMVYPGSFSTLAEIAGGEHPETPEELRDLVVVSLHLRGRTRGPAPLGARPRIERGQIYRDVYAKRVDDHEASVEADLARAWLDNGELRFAARDQRERALADGIFLLQVPSGLELAAGDAFSRQFFQGKAARPYGRFRDLGPDRFGDPLLGFHQRINQIEQFLLERRFWHSHYPAEIAALGEALTRLSQRLLRAVLAQVRIPPQDWQRATGGCSELGGSYHLTFNHYRPQHEGCGLSSHKDDGFLTILRTTAPGLEVNRHSRWERVPVDPDFFVVNFGLSMEILTAPLSTPVAAIMHRVSHQAQDRSSFGHFTSSCCLPGSDQGIYRYRPGHGLERVCASRELIDNNDYEIYQGTERPEEYAP